MDPVALHFAEDAVVQAHGGDLISALADGPDQLPKVTGPRGCTLDHVEELSDILQDEGARLPLAEIESEAFVNDVIIGVILGAASF